MSEKSMYDILTDSDDLDNIVLCDADGKETEFEQIATVNLDDEIYCILCPLEDGKPTDEGYVFSFTQKDGKELLTLVEDENKYNEVFARYEEAIGSDSEH